MKRILFTLFLCFHYALTHAQFGGFGGSDNKIYDGKISGQLVDADSQQPVEIANVALYKAGSEKPIDGTVTDEKGNFKLKNIKPGYYKLSVSFLGYTTKDFDSLQITDKKPSVELGKISFEANTQVLKEAVVEGEKSLVETKIDKIIYNAEKDISVKGGNATDVLRKVPMVSVDLDGNVMLQGTQNIKVLINNKPSSIMASSIADALKMIPADEVEKVEVITSPSAKYDAEGTGGIINIITKRKNIQGLSGSIYAGAGTRSSNLFSGLNYRKDRFGTGLNIGGFGYRGKGSLSAVRTTDYSVLTQEGDNKNFGYGPYIQWTTDYDLNSKNNVSSSLRLNNFNNKSEGNTYNNFTNDGIPSGLNYQNNFETKTDGWSYDGSIDYRRKFTKEDQEFSVTGQITNNDRNTNYDITRIYDLGINPFYTETSLNNSRNREYTFQTDYTHPFSKKFTLETGGKSITRKVTSDYDYKVLFGDVFIDDTERSNVFDYGQNVFAGYLQNSVTLDKFGIKVGGRFEHTEVDGEFDKDSTSFENSYNNFIPSSTISYRKQGKYNLKLSYTQRIQRPSMNFLNPYVNYSDLKNITYGNPNLEPEKSHAFEFGYSLFKKFGSINTSVYHRFTNNAIESVRFIDTNDVYITTYDNIGKNYSTGMSISTNIMWQSKIILGGNFNVFYYKVKSTDPLLSLDNDGINYSVNFYFNYKFNTTWGVQAFGNFNGPRYSVQGKSTSFFYYNLSARYSLKEDKGGIGLGVDNFATPYIYFKNEYKGSDFTYSSTNKMNFIGVRLSFDYRFGKMDFRAPKKRGVKNDDLKEGGDDSQGGQMGGGR